MNIIQSTLYRYHLVKLYRP